MATVVYLHAHPDDEASQTSGSMARASREGHRVVVVYGTNGDHGEVPADLAPGDTVVTYRRREAEASAQVTGTARVAWLGYADSGMSGWEQNSAADAFALADLDEAAGRLAAILDEEDAAVLVGYDWHGGYGHPDHVKVHHVAHRAAELAARRPRLLESTMNRDHMRRQFAAAREAGMPMDWDPDQPMDDGNPFGTPEAEIHWRVDVSDLVETKRAALACHRSQATDIEMFLAMPVEVFAAGFGQEWYLEPGRPPGLVDGWWLDPA
ncbi:PIG-L deacetylase family protein [Arsenicicoccus sp. oral taxon 190]|uniref:PIG-L deacetylase family protein n=1 Tax=Arsenicicoccus sp. oral taxon 190 TaxID=1658671 RepID=UPI000679FE49|nr:PIG-L family deacetylase [Arsenicicoccus sp. oral taxon 190]AKT51028.1 GlcNAc-PI de-N-acetylase [Arsenicicoccus sp. oral taxon 190]